MYSVSIALQLAFLKYISIYSVVVLKLTFPSCDFSIYLISVLPFYCFVCPSVWGGAFMYTCEHAEALRVFPQILSLPAGLD